MLLRRRIQSRDRPPPSLMHTGHPVMMFVWGLILVAGLLSACGPTKSTGGSMGETGTSTLATGAEATSSETTVVVTMGDGSTAGSTSEEPVCPWNLPGNESYCPLLTMANTDIAGDTPFGPLSFKYAYFGLYQCYPCPTPYSPALGLFAQEQQPGLDPLVGDRLILHYNDGFDPLISDLWIGNDSVQPGKIIINATDTIIPTTEQTTPPLDLDAPPTMTGSLSITGDGWMVQGSFNATLCTGLNWSSFCE